MTDDRHQVTCPVNGCTGTIKIRRDLPAGTYDCLCHHRKLRLSWTTFANFSCHPTLVEEQP